MKLKNLQALNHSGYCFSWTQNCEYNEAMFIRNNLFKFCCAVVLPELSVFQPHLDITTGSACSGLSDLLRASHEITYWVSIFSVVLTTAVRWCPFSSACFTTSFPVRPVAPNTTSLSFFEAPSAEAAMLEVVDSVRMGWVRVTVGEKLGTRKWHCLNVV